MHPKEQKEFKNVIRLYISQEEYSLIFLTFFGLITPASSTYSAEMIY